MYLCVSSSGAEPVYWGVSRDVGGAWGRCVHGSAPCQETKEEQCRETQNQRDYWWRNPRYHTHTQQTSFTFHTHCSYLKSSDCWCCVLFSSERLVCEVRQKSRNIEGVFSIECENYIYIYIYIYIWRVWFQNAINPFWLIWVKMCFLYQESGKMKTTIFCFKLSHSIFM